MSCQLVKLREKHQEYMILLAYYIDAAHKLDPSELFNQKLMTRSQLKDLAAEIHPDKTVYPG